MTWIWRSWSFLVLIVPAAILVLACGSDTLVGGGCREGLAECSLKCVDLRRDPVNCGACGRRCGPGQICAAGTCGGDGDAVDGAASDVALGDGTPNEGPLVDGSTYDVSMGDASTADASTGDASTGDVSPADASTRDGGPTCPPPFDTPEHCGDCATRCTDPTPLCGLSGTFRCVSRCDPPLVACGANCTDTFSDENNCGMCGRVCASGICQGGTCVGKGFGHEIVIGMDYSDATLSQTSAQVTMLGNAMFLGGTANVRVLAYDEFAEPATVARIQSWLSGLATARGRTLSVNAESDWSAVTEELTVASYDVFLIYDQLTAPLDRMATTGTLWHGAMGAFAKGGGIIVVLDGGSVGRMRDLLTNGGLLTVLDEADVTGTPLDVDAPTDVVGLNLPNVFSSKKATIGFTTTQVADNLHVFVVKDSVAKLPVVVHSVPPQ